MKINLCNRKAKCELLQENTCLGAKLPYSFTSMDLSMLPNQRIARDALEKLRSTLINIPRCWSVIQPFLCAILFPPCSNNTTMQLPSKEMCLITKGPCQIVEHGKWPDFLKCNEDYASNCKSISQDLTFNTTGKCSLPLVETTREERWYKGIRGCGVQCANPLFTLEENKDIQRFIKWLGGISLAFSVITVLTFLIQWRGVTYPEKIVFYMNACYLVAVCAFMFQFQVSSKESIACHSDGTLRQGEPSSEDNLACLVVFVLIYYFMLAAGMWFVILGYSWYKIFISYKSGAGRGCRVELEHQGSYFHLIAWSLPLIFTIAILALAEVDADSVSGICFLSSSLYVRVVFLLIPFGLCVLVGCGLFIQGTIVLMGFKINTNKGQDKKKVIQIIIRRSFFAVLVFILYSFSIYFHIYYYTNFKSWQESLREYILCTSKIIEPREYGESCSMENRPSTTLYKLHLGALFATGIAFSTWKWKANSVEAWQRFGQRLCGTTEDDQRRIDQAYGRRKRGQMSSAAHSLPTDPLWNILNFPMNSAVSGDVSMVGMQNFNDHTIFGISRRVSIDSRAGRRTHGRRHSLDSQMSFHVSDMERKVARKTASHFLRHRLNRRKKPYRKDRRASNTSDDSNLGSCSGILPSLMMSTQDSLFTKTMKIVNSTNQKPILKDQQGVTLNSEDSGAHVTADVLDKNTQFSRKFDAQRRTRNKSLTQTAKQFQSETIKASIGVQTSLESLDVEKPFTEDKCCQVSPSLIRASDRLFRDSSALASLSSSDGSPRPLIFQNNLADIHNTSNPVPYATVTDPLTRI